MPEFLQTLPHKGEICSLLCAFLWATATLFFRKAGEQLPPFSLNFYKNSLVLLLLIPTAVFLGHTSIPNLPSSTWQLIFMSGLIGICLADYLFFKGLHLLGAGRNAIVNCSYSLFMFLFSSMYLGEQLRSVHILGSSLVIVGIVLASIKFHKDHPTLPASTKDRIYGIIYGLLAMALTAIGVLLVKPIMQENVLPVDVIAILRLIAGILGAVLFLTITGRMGSTLRLMQHNFPWKSFSIGTFLGGYLAMVIWLLGYKHTEANTAAILNQTSTLFTVILAAMFLNEPLTKGKSFGALIAFGGVAVILLNR